MNISVAQNSHYGVAVDTFAREVETRTGGRYKVQNVLRRRARRRARVGRGRPARHARPHADVDRPAAEFRARGRDPRHPVPVPRLRARPRRARRPDRPGDAAEVPAEGHRRARLGRERLPPHDEQQAAGQRARRPQGPQDADDGEPDPHPGVQAVRHPADADGVHRGVHRAAAGHGRRPGESAVGHHVGEARPGAEEPVAHRSRLFARGDPDEQGAVGQAVRRPTSRRSSMRRRRP